MKSKTEFLRKYLPGLLLLLGAIALTAFAVGRFRVPGQSNMIESLAMDMNAMKPEPGSAPVGTVRAEIRSERPELTYSGTVRGLNEISIAARVDGTLSAVPVYAGSRVARGQMLAQLEAPELTAQLGSARAEQAQARGELAVIEQEAVRLRAEEQAAAAGIGEARADLNAAEADAAYWRERLPREKTLYEAGGIALEEFQRWQADARVAESRVSAARQRVQAAQGERRARAAMLGENAARRRAQLAGINRAGAGVRERQVSQGFTRITAPVGGIVTERLLPPGSVVSAGTPILTLAQIDPVRIQISVPEADLAGLRIGGHLSLTPSGRDPIEASISSIAPAAGSGTRTHTVEAIVPNPKGALLPGQYVKARLRRGEAGAPAPAVPERAIIQLQGQDAVWTVRNGRAHLVTVEVSGRSGDWALVKHIDKGTEVISDGWESLTEGMPVTPVKWTENGPEQLPDAGGAHRLNEANDWSLQARVGEDLTLRVTIDPKPPKVSGNTLSFGLFKGSEPVPGARISLESSMPAMNMGGPNLKTDDKGQGRYSVAFSGMSGLWQFVAVIETGGRRLKPFTFEFNMP